MAGKLTTILARKEAEVYCAHGLHQEALSLYKRLLASSPKMGTAFKRAIENQMAVIKTQLLAGRPNEHSKLSAMDILRLKEGWGSTATEGDLLVCAQAFYRIGHFRSALSELTKLMEKGCAMKGIMGLFADCLVGLCRPHRLLATTNRITLKIFARPEAHLGFMLRLAEKMVARKQPAHALAIYRHLQENAFIKTKAPRRLAAIAKGIKALQQTNP